MLPLWVVPEDPISRNFVVCNIAYYSWSLTFPEPPSSPKTFQFYLGLYLYQRCFALAISYRSKCFPNTYDEGVLVTALFE